MRTSIDRHSALIYTMVLVSAAEGRMSDRELDVRGLLGHLERELDLADLLRQRDHPDPRAADPDGLSRREPDQGVAQELHALVREERLHDRRAGGIAALKSAGEPRVILQQTKERMFAA